MSLSYQKEARHTDFVQLSAGESDEDCDVEDQKDKLYGTVEPNGVLGGISGNAAGEETTCSWEYIIDEVW